MNGICRNWQVSIDFEVILYMNGICQSWNWEVSIDFEVFDVWRVIYIGLHGTGMQKNNRVFDII